MSTKRQKRKKTNSSNGVIVEKKERPIWFYTRDLMPHEFAFIYKMVEDFLRTVDYTEALENIKGFLSSAMAAIEKNRYSGVVALYSSYGKDRHRPIGYCWYEITVAVNGKNKLEWKHLYIQPEYAQNRRAFRCLTADVLDKAERAKVEYWVIEASDQKTQLYWKRFGYKIVTVRLQFDGTVKDLLNHTKRLKEFYDKEDSCYGFQEQRNNQAIRPEPICG